MVKNKKHLGQHWLMDRQILTDIAKYATNSDAKNDKPSGTVLEIGPGLGTLTSVLLKFFNQVVAVEYDPDLAAKLPGQFTGKNLTVINQDILRFNLTSLPPGYSVVANVPYYITGKIIQTLLTSANKPKIAVLLVQKEVAERLAAPPRKLTILGISAQIYAKVSLGVVVPAEKFTPPPKVDSQVVILKTHNQNPVAALDEKAFFRLVKIGFASPRKKLAKNLSAGLALTKETTQKILSDSHIDPDYRPQDLSLTNWLELTKTLKNRAII
jgi:16S rRNA (adenine1518-N6/adenine1519-N6)-dimethyltransferase